MQQRLLNTPLFSVERRSYESPGGDRVERCVVVHPGAVVILPVLDDKRIVMIRNFRYSIEQTLLELPAGTREPNESPIETAARELEEETGYRAGRLEPLTEFYTSPGIMTERMHAFAAFDLTPVGQRLEPSEQIKVEIFAMAEAKELLTSGGIQDGKSIATLGTYLLQHP